jgi:formyltetrahydrofolate-dependent phosphoribosylglycinamide formyltransferase
MARRLVVLISGNGSNLQAILDACTANELNAAVVAVISNKRDAYGLERARQAGIPAIARPRPLSQPREQYDTELADLVASYAPDFVVLAGWMRVLSNAFLSRFPGQVVNLHPALPGCFPGTDAIARAYDDHVTQGLRETGVMVHFVPDEGVDSGPLIAVERVPILLDDTLDALTARMHAVEHRLLVAALKLLTP